MAKVMAFWKKKNITVVTLLFLSLTVWSAALARVKIAVWGDSRENKDGATEQIADILLRKITDWDFQIHTGDFTHHGAEEDWQRSLSYKGVRELFVKGKFFMCTSNHDNNVTTWDKYTAGVLPTNPIDHTTHFYSILYETHPSASPGEKVQVVFCDGYFTDDSTMTKWLDRVLAKVTKDTWLIGVWHNPCYGDITYKSSYLKECRPWLERLYEHGGDFILHGHAHVYVRTRPLLPDGTVDPMNGMVHIINGTGGASWKDPQPHTEKTAFTPGERSFPSIAFITIGGNTALVQAIDARPGKNLRVIDEWKWVR